MHVHVLLINISFLAQFFVIASLFEIFMSIWLTLFPLDIARIFIRFAFIEVKRRKIKDAFKARW